MSDTSHSAFNSSLTDMMTSLMVIFVLLLVNYIRNDQHAAESNRKTVKQTIEEALKNVFQGDAFEGVSVIEDAKDPYTLIVIVPEKWIQFDKSRAILKEIGEQFLGELTPKLLSIVCSDELKDALSSIVIEGHTDPDQNPNDPYFNLRLSQDRSLVVMKSMLRNAGNNHSCFLDLSSASGRGERECKAELTSLEPEKERCRKVEFKIRVKSLEEKKIQDAVQSVELD